MYFMNSKHRFLACTVFLSVCFGFTDFFIKAEVLEQTQKQVKDIQSRVKPAEELSDFDVAELPPYVAYHFDADAEDPFLVKSFVREISDSLPSDDFESCLQGGCGDGPPVPHAPYFLEEYNMDQLAMVGTLDDPGKGRVALIKTPDSGVITSAIGEYIGRNNGLILSINREKMIIREKYRSPQGWKDRMATLNLIRN